MRKQKLVRNWMHQLFTAKTGRGWFVDSVRSAKTVRLSCWPNGDTATRCDWVGKLCQGNKTCTYAAIPRASHFKEYKYDKILKFKCDQTNTCVGLFLDYKAHDFQSENENKALCQIKQLLGKKAPRYLHCSVPSSQQSLNQRDTSKMLLETAED